MFIEEWEDYRVCGVCGRDNAWDDYDWPSDDICPGCEAEEEFQQKMARRMAAERKKERAR